MLETQERKASTIKPIPALSPLVRQSNKKIKLYNFRNPDKFSKDHLKAISSIHEIFARQSNITLSAALRMSTDIVVANTQQMTYADYLSSMPDDLITYSLNMFPLSGNFSLGVEKHIMGSITDRMLGGTGMSSLKDELTDVEIGIAKDVIKKLLAFIPEGWQSLIPADSVEMVDMEQSPTKLQIVAPTDIISLVTLNVEIGSYLGFMNICIPYSAIEDWISRLTRQTTARIDKVNEEESRETVLTKVSGAPVPVKIVLAKGKLRLSEIMDLNAGDVVKLNTSAKEDAEVWVGDKLKFFGKAGKSDNKFSIAVTNEHNED